MSRKIKCSGCKAEFAMREYSPGHVGVDAYRCDRCACSVAKNKASVPPGYRKGHDPIEAYFSHCECGGRFVKEAPYRCPVCHAPIDVSSLYKADVDITKRDSSEFYVEGYNRVLSWKGD